VYQGNHPKKQSVKYNNYKNTVSRYPSTKKGPTTAVHERDIISIQPPKRVVFNSIQKLHNGGLDVVKNPVVTLIPNLSNTQKP